MAKKKTIGMGARSTYHPVMATVETQTVNTPDEFAIFWKVVRGVLVAYFLISLFYIHVWHPASIAWSFTLGAPKPDEYFPRPQKEEFVRKLVQPDSFPGMYPFFSGPRACGKSTLIRHVVERGMYFMFKNEMTIDQLMEIQLGASLIFQPVVFLYGLFWIKGSAPYLGQDWVPVLERGAYLYSLFSPRPAVVIFDQVHLLAMSDPKGAAYLLRLCKRWAQTKVLVPVLVSSEGILPMVTLGEHSIGRSLNYEIGDLTEAEAKEYLAWRGVNPEEAGQIYAVAGPRISLLQELSNPEKEDLLSARIESMLGSTQNHLRAHFNDIEDLHDARTCALWKIFQRLLAETRIHLSQLQGFGNEIVQLSDADVVYVWTGGEVTFDTRVMERVVKDLMVKKLAQLLPAVCNISVVTPDSQS